MKLRLTVPLGSSETPASYASRLAAANGLSARDFCHDWNLRFQSIVDGEADAIRVIARLGGVDPDVLIAHAFVKVGPRTFDHRGERLVRNALRRSRVHVCAVCLLDDIKSNPKLSPALAIHNRAAWMIDCVRTCPFHTAGLLQVAQETNPHAIHDFVRSAEPSLHCIERLAAMAPQRHPTALEKYVMARLDGVRKSAFLDSLDLYAAIHTCDIIGAVDLFGRTVNLQRLGDHDWLRAGESGFLIARGGADTISDFLSRLQNTHKGRGRDGLQAPFGRVYQWLAFFAKDRAYDPVRRIVAEHIRAHFPAGPGDTIFGLPVTERKQHSICTLASESGLHPVRLRKTLRAAGIINDRQMRLTDNLVLFDAEQAMQIVRRSASAISLPRAAKRLNVSLKQAQAFAAERFVVPFLPALTSSVRARYAIEDLDAFLDSLLLGAQIVRRPLTNMADIPTATKRASCSTGQIVRLILGRKLAWVGKAVGRRGYLSVLMDVEEIRAKTPRTDHGGLSKGDVMRRLRTTHAVVDALIKRRHLRAIPAVNPVNRYQKVVIAPEEFARFDREYVSLYALTEDQGKHFTVVRKALERRGVAPAFKPSEIGATFYRRRDC